MQKNTVFLKYSCFLKAPLSIYRKLFDKKFDKNFYKSVLMQKRNINATSSREKTSFFQMLQGATTFNIFYNCFPFPWCMCFLEYSKASCRICPTSHIMISLQHMQYYNANAFIFLFALIMQKCRFFFALFYKSYNEVTVILQYHQNACMIFFIGL